MPVERKRTITPLMVGLPLNRSSDERDYAVPSRPAPRSGARPASAPMPPDPGNAWRPSPRSRPVAPRNRQVPFGRTTEEFFVEGEQHEATQWEDANLPPDDEPEPKRWRGRVDKVPRQRGAMVALAVFAVCLVLGVAAGVSALLKTGPHLDDVVAAVKSLLPMSSEPGSSSTSLPVPEALQGAPTAQAPQTESQPQLPMQSQAQAPSPAQASLAQVPPQSPPQPAPQPAPSQPASPRPSETPVAIPPAPGPVPIPAIVPAAPPSPTKPRSATAFVEESSTAAGRGAPARTASAPQPASRVGRAVTPKRAQHRQSRDNYVWSPELNALVPASSMSEADQAASRPTEARKPEADTSSVTKAIRELPNPFESDGLAPPPMPAKAMISPATTGAAAHERPAPSGDDADPFQK